MHTSFTRAMLRLAIEESPARIDELERITRDHLASGELYPGDVVEAGKLLEAIEARRSELSLPVDPEAQFLARIRWVLSVIPVSTDLKELDSVRNMCACRYERGGMSPMLEKVVCHVGEQAYKRMQALQGLNS